MRCMPFAVNSTVWNMQADQKDETDKDSNKMQSILKGLLFYKKTFVIGVYYFCKLKKKLR